MNKNFAFPLLVSGAEEDLARLHSQLVSLGYISRRIEHPYSKPAGRICLCTDWGNYTDCVGYTNEAAIYNRTQLQLPQDCELALALAAMRKEGAFEKGELLVLVSNTLHVKAGELAMVISDRHSKDPGELVEIRWMDEAARNTQSWGEDHGYNDGRFRRATREEIINFYRHGSPVLKSDPLPFPAPETRKIVGYKAPFGLYGGRVKAGTIYKQIGGSTNYGCGDVSGVLPVEIVETWEPVYEEVKPKPELITIGQNKKMLVEVLPGKSIRCEGKDIDVNSVQGLYNSMHIHRSASAFPWDIVEIEATIGCLVVNREDLKKVLDAYEGGKA
jgi:hypothetical protein